ncbi:MAG: hypothetical protein IKP32_04235 [Clostridia bacterium]|nr:hypothetical protein [Clostridia bacterium]
MNSGKSRSGLIGLVAAYLIYIAYELYQGRNDPKTTMTPAVRIICIVFFGVVSVALLVYAYRIWKQGSREEEKPPEKEDESLK